MGSIVSKNYLPSIKSSSSIYPYPFAPSSEIIYDDILIDSLLGKGGFSNVYHGQYFQRGRSKSSSSSHHLAIKRINIMKLLQCTGNENASLHAEQNPGLRAIHLLFQELHAFIRILSHEFIVNLHQAFHYDIYCFLVMDCLSGGNLRNLLRYERILNEKSVVYIVACIGAALHHIHSRGVIHRDVKPDNIGLDELGRPYLTDFGISYLSKDPNKLHLLCDSSSGTLPYMAPEVLAPGHHHSYQSDFWSLGVMAYELCYSYRPFIKHCPPRLVQFVANEYGSMWRKLKETTDISHTSFEFQSIRAADELIPFPKLNLELNADGSVPSCLLLGSPEFLQSSPSPSSTIISQAYSTGQTVSVEFMELLSGLLDIRIPHRLGSFQHFHKFTQHHCFLLNDLYFTQMNQLPSPLIRKFPLNSHLTPLSSPRPLIHAPPAEKQLELPPDIEKELYEYSYINPSSPHRSSATCTSQSLNARHDKCNDKTLHTEKLTGAGVLSMNH